MLKLRRKRKIKQSDYKRLTPPGAAPGTLVKAPDATMTTVRKLAWGGTSPLAEGELEDLNEIQQLFEKHLVSWIDVRGLGDLKKLRP